MTDRLRTANDLEQTFRDAADLNYADSLETENEGVGWDPIAADARTLERASYAVRRNTQAYYLLPSSMQSDDPASGPVHASTVVTLRRAVPVDAELRIPAGELLRHSVRDSTGAPAVLQDFTTAAEAVFPAGNAGPVSVLALATRPGDQGNFPALTLDGLADTADAVIACTVSAGNVLTDTGIPDVFYAGLVGRYLRFASGVNAGAIRRVLTFQGGPLGVVTLEGAALTVGSATVSALSWDDLGVTLEQPDAITDGRHGTLDQIGRERSMGRADGESDGDFAYRMSGVPDAVSPNAIDRVCAAILTPHSIRWTIHETRIGITGVILDEAPLDVGELCGDRLTEPWAGSVLLSSPDATRFFVVCVSEDQNLGAFGVPFDAANDGLNAYDVGGQIDGYPLTYNQVIAQLYRALTDAHMGGVGWEIVQDPDL